MPIKCAFSGAFGELAAVASGAGKGDRSDRGNQSDIAVRNPMRFSSRPAVERAGQSDAARLTLAAEAAFQLDVSMLASMKSNAGSPIKRFLITRIDENGNAGELNENDEETRAAHVTRRSTSTDQSK